MRDYWLGRLSETEIDNCELEWFSNDEDSQRLDAARTELIEEFLAGALPAGDKMLFEKNFLAVPTNLRDVAVVEAYQRTVKAEKVESFLAPPAPASSTESKRGFWQSFFAPSRLAFAAVVLLVLVGGFALLNGLRSSDKIARTNVNVPLPSPAPQTTPSAPPPSPETTVSPRPETETPPKNTNATPKPSPSQTPSPKVETSPPAETVPTPPKQPGNVILTVALTFGNVRSGGNQIDSVEIPPNYEILRLQVIMPPLTERYRSYAAKIVDENGQIVAQPKLPNLNDRATRSLIDVDIPTSKLATGNYKISIVGRRADGTSKEFQPVPFNIQKD